MGKVVCIWKVFFLCDMCVHNIEYKGTLLTRWSKAASKQKYGSSDTTFAGYYGGQEVASEAIS